MRSTFAIWTCSLVACGKGAEPSKLPPVVASMDFVSKALHGTNRLCVDIYDANVVENWSALCKQQMACSMRRGLACEFGEHHGGCLQRDGSIAWLLEGTTSCVLGKWFSGEAPAPVAAKPFHCQGPTACQEMTSVFDLAPTVESPDCATSGGTFAAGACPAGETGRCRLEGQIDRSVLVLYPPLTVAQAMEQCESVKGHWL